MVCFFFRRLGPNMEAQVGFNGVGSIASWTQGEIDKSKPSGDKPFSHDIDIDIDQALRDAIAPGTPTPADRPATGSSLGSITSLDTLTRSTRKKRHQRAAKLREASSAAASTILRFSAQAMGLCHNQPSQILSLGLGMEVEGRWVCSHARCLALFDSAWSETIDSHRTPDRRVGGARRRLDAGSCRQVNRDSNDRPECQPD